MNYDTVESQPWAQNWATFWAKFSTSLDMSQNSKYDLGQVLGPGSGPTKMSIELHPRATQRRVLKFLVPVVVAATLFSLPKVNTVFPGY